MLNVCALIAKKVYDNNLIAQDRNNASIAKLPMTDNSVIIRCHHSWCGQSGDLGIYALSWQYTAKENDVSAYIAFLLVFLSLPPLFFNVLLT